MVIHGTSKVDITIDEHLEVHQINVELVQAPKPAKPSSSTSMSSSTTAADDENDNEIMTIEIYSKRWRWPPVRLANVFYLNKN